MAVVQFVTIKTMLPIKNLIQQKLINFDYLSIYFMTVIQFAVIDGLFSEVSDIQSNGHTSSISIKKPIFTKYVQFGLGIGGMFSEFDDIQSFGHKI